MLALTAILKEPVYVDASYGRPGPSCVACVV
jgi:hypothetical protein